MVMRFGGQLEFGDKLNLWKKVHQISSYKKNYVMLKLAFVFYHLVIFMEPKIHRFNIVGLGCVYLKLNPIFQFIW